MRGMLALFAVASIVLCSLGVNGELVFEEPKRGIGDYWTYNITPEQNITYGYKEVRYLRAETINLNGTNYECNVILSVCNLNYSDEEGNTTKYTTTYVYETVADHLTIKTEAHADVVAVMDEGEMSMEIDTTCTYSPGWNEYKFPMKNGDSWSWTYNVHRVTKTYIEGMLMSSNDETVQEAGGEAAIDEEAVTIGLGTFDCLKIVSGLGFTYWYSSKIGYIVKSLDDEVNTVWELTSYHFGDASNATEKPNGAKPVPGFEGALALLACVAAIAIVGSIRKLRR